MDDSNTWIATFFFSILYYKSFITFSNRRIQRDLEAAIPVWAPKLGAQERFLVQYILSSIHSDK